MHIFLDESGPFIPLNGEKHKVSVVGALVIPTHSLADVFGEYLTIRPELHFRQDEPKGSVQSEAQVARIARLLERHQALLFVSCVDTGQHTEEDIHAFQDGQAARLFADMPDTESDETKLIVARLQESMRRLPLQLFVQCLLYMAVVEHVLRHSTLYHVQRTPRELADFVWTVDQKADRPTPMEQLWRELIMPWIRTKDLPLAMLDGADYSHFATYEAPDLRDPDRVLIDLRAIFDRLHFQDSREDPGLELADIVISAMGRGLNGQLGRRGWEPLGDLMIHVPPQSLHFARLSPRPDEQGIVHERDAPYLEVVRTLDSRAKPMLTEEMRQEATGGRHSDSHIVTHPGF